MAYRDDLEAAHARIEALEQQLAATSLATEGARTLIARTRAIESQLADIQERTREVVERHQRLVAALRPSSDELPTLTEFNRTKVPGKHAMSGEPGGVRCPMCAAIGDAVEMHLGGNLRVVIDLDGVAAAKSTVRCPRCSYLALKSA